MTEPTRWEAAPRASSRRTPLPSYSGPAWRWSAAPTSARARRASRRRRRRPRDQRRAEPAWRGHVVATGCDQREPRTRFCCGEREGGGKGPRGGARGETGVWGVSGGNERPTGGEEAAKGRRLGAAGRCALPVRKALRPARFSLGRDPVTVYVPLGPVAGYVFLLAVTPRGWLLTWRARRARRGGWRWGRSSG